MKKPLKLFNLRLYIFALFLNYHICSTDIDSSIRSSITLTESSSNCSHENLDQNEKTDNRIEHKGSTNSSAQNDYSKIIIGSTLGIAVFVILVWSIYIKNQNQNENNLTI